MACRGVFFALTHEESDRLLSAKNSDEVVDIIIEEIEERWDRNWLQEMDKSWDAVHRCLGDGSLNTRATTDRGKAVLGGKHLSDRDDYIVCYHPLETVAAIAEALDPVSKDWFRKRYFGLRRKFLWIDLTQYDGPIDEGDFDYSWSYFEEMRCFFHKAASAERAVVFSVDQ